MNIADNNVVYSVEDLKDFLKPVFDKYPIKRGFIFGSYARGEATPKSDIDLFVEPDEGFRIQDVCGILGGAHRILKKEVDCYSSLEFNKDSKILPEIFEDRVQIYGKET